MTYNMIYGIKLLKQQRRQAERSWRKDNITIKKQIYQHHCQLVKRAIDAAKKEYYRSRITSCTTSKALYQVTNTLSGKEKATSLPEHIPKQQLPDHFCAYFHDKVSSIRKELCRRLCRRALIRHFSRKKIGPFPCS